MLRALSFQSKATAARVAKLSFASPLQVRYLTTVSPTREEKQGRWLSQRNIQKSLEALHHDGIVMIKDVIDHESIDALNKRMTLDTHTLIGRGDQGPFNYNLGNLQQCPPYEIDTFSSEIFVNPVASQITNAYLGEKPTMSFISSNAAIKADQRQPVHCDADFDHPKIPFAAVVNVGLVDMSPTNGSTEVWLGTHRDTCISHQEGSHGDRASGRIRQDLLQARRKISPPIQPTVPKGSILIRDLRLWHAGMPNKTNEVRIMLAMIHFAPWYRQRMLMKLPQQLQPILEEVNRLAISADWVEDSSIDHLSAAYGNAFDFSQDQ